MIRVLSNLIRSPIVQASALFAALFVVAFILAPPAIVNDVLDGFAIAGCALALYRFGCHAREALTARHPDGSQVMIVSVAGIVLSIGAIRALREFGLELGLIESIYVAYAFGGITVVMVFAIFLLVVAPPVQGGKLNLTPWTAFILAFGFGTLFSAAIIAMRWWW